MPMHASRCDRPRVSQTLVKLALSQIAQPLGPIWPQSLQHPGPSVQGEDRGGQIGFAQVG
jgi:hypothetical protein